MVRWFGKLVIHRFFQVNHEAGAQQSDANTWPSMAHIEWYLFGPSSMKAYPSSTKQSRKGIADRLTVSDLFTKSFYTLRSGRLDLLAILDVFGDR